VASDEVTPTRFYKFWVTEPDTGKRSRTTWRMSEASARDYIDAEPDLGTLEMRSLPDSPDEYNVARKPPAAKTMS
jgi:hypothetical protein